MLPRDTLWSELLIWPDRLRPLTLSTVIMFYRQKVILGLLETFGGSLPSTDFQKYLFLFTRLCQTERSYEFVPYKFGCFSFQSYADKAKLIKLGHLASATDWVLTNPTGSYVKQLKKGDDKKLDYFLSKYGALTGKKLLQHVYKGYPYYAINSLVAEEILSPAALNEVKRHQVESRQSVFATIGYEGLTIEAYINKLIKNDIRLLVDVRKNPLSRKYGFSKSLLSDLLGKLGIDYYHMPKLGIVSDKRKELKTKSDYTSLFSEYEKTVLVKEHDTLRELYDIYLKNKRIAITCFEECHTFCHRHKVANAITQFAGEEFKIVHL